MIQRTYDNLLESSPNDFEDMLINGIIEEIANGRTITITSTNVGESIETFEKEKEIIQMFYDKYPKSKDYIIHECA